MADRNRVDSLFITGVDLLGRAEEVGDILLTQVVVFPQLTNTLPNVFQAAYTLFYGFWEERIPLLFFHKNSTINLKWCIDITLYVVYNRSDYKIFLKERAQL